MTKKILILLFALLVTLPARATDRPPTPEDFAYGSPLEVPLGKPFSSLDLPLEVYRSIVRPDLGDLRVFNGCDQPVLHLLKRPAAKVGTHCDQLRTAVPFFPILAAKGKASENLTLHVEKNALGTIIDVRSLDLPEAAGEKRLVGYLLDLTAMEGWGYPKTSGNDSGISHSEPMLVPGGYTGDGKGSARMALRVGGYARPGFRWAPVRSLELDWNQPGVNFLGNLEIATSTDMVHWSHLTTASLARLEHQGYHLDLHSISLPLTTSPYLRLTWPEGQEGIVLHRVEALAAVTGITVASSLTWLPDPIQPSKSDAEGTLFDLGGQLPVERLRLQLPQSNSMAAATLSSATAATGPFTLEWQGLLYHLMVDGQYINNPEITVAASHRRFWRVTFKESESGPPEPPTLTVGWQADRLLFLAQGEGPFRLYYGSSEVQPADSKSAGTIGQYPLADGRDLPPVPAKIGPRFVQGGEICLQPTRPWRKYILWLLLASGVLLIAWMSSSLYRQLNAGKAK